jgi:hypothetical protein
MRKSGRLAWGDCFHTALFVTCFRLSFHLDLAALCRFAFRRTDSQHASCCAMVLPLSEAEAANCRATPRRWRLFPSYASRNQQRRRCGCRRAPNHAGRSTASTSARVTRLRRVGKPKATAVAMPAAFQISAPRCCLLDKRGNPCAEGGLLASINWESQYARVDACVRHQYVQPKRAQSSSRLRPMRSLPTHFWSTSGTMIEPSACWQFSRMAISARLMATAVPLRVWTKFVPFSPFTL